MSGITSVHDQPVSMLLAACSCWLTYVVVQLLQHSFIHLDHKGASVSVVKDCKLSTSPLCCHLVKGHLNAAFLPSYVRHLHISTVCLDASSVTLPALQTVDKHVCLLSVRECSTVCTVSAISFDDLQACTDLLYGVKLVHEAHVQCF